MLTNEVTSVHSGCCSRSVPGSMTVGESQATEKLCALWLHPADYSVYAVETRRRIKILVREIIFNPAAKQMEFSAETLAKMTAWFDAMPKPLGYLYLQTLEREAKILIPKPVHCPLDIGELLTSITVCLINFPNMNCPQLIIGLFIMLFHTQQRFKMLSYDWVEYVNRITKAYEMYQRSYYGAGI